MQMDEFSYLWDGSEIGWGLLHLNNSKPNEPPRYGIVNLENREGVIIEDNEAYGAVVRQMLKHGAKVLTSLPWARKPGS